MLSLLWGLLFRPRVTMESILKTPNLRLASQLNFLIILLLMVNVVFYFATDPNVSNLGPGKWVLAFFIPPLQYWVQRAVYWVSIRLGLLMVAGNRLPRDPLEKRHKLALVNYAFPYVIYPMLFCLILSTLFDSESIQSVILLIGAINMFVLLTNAVKQIYNLPTARAFWGPFLVQFLISIVFAFLIVLIVAIYMILHGGSVPGM